MPPHGNPPGEKHPQAESGNGEIDGQSQQVQLAGSFSCDLNQGHAGAQQRRQDGPGDDQDIGQYGGAQRFIPHEKAQRDRPEEKRRDRYSEKMASTVK